MTASKISNLRDLSLGWLLAHYGERNLLEPAGMELSDAVFERLKGCPDYRPKNLLRYPCAHPELHDKLSQEVRSAL